MEEPYTKRLACTEADYEIVKRFAYTRAAVPRAGTKKPSLAPALEELLEIAYRCIADHGAEFAKPARHHQALEIRRKAKTSKIPNRKPGRPRGAKDSRPRKRRHVA